MLKRSPVATGPRRMPCVGETLMTKKLLEEGHTLREIRAAVDQAFGGNAPGTSPELPPA